MGSLRAKRLRPLAGLAPDTLLVHEIYASVQGESTHVGQPCVFVRTTACNLRCRYCDTPHAFVEGTPWRLEDIEAEVARFGLPLVEVTGGEPLLQPLALVLMRRLCDLGYEVLLETGGSLDIGEVDPRVVRIVDFKAPSSGELAANRYANIALLRPCDEVKLVVGDRADYEWARTLIAEHRLSERCSVLVGPVFGAVAPRELVEWILEDKLPVRFQLQLHKHIWDPATRGV